MKCIRIFLDYWVVKRLFEEPSFLASRERLSALVKRGYCAVALSIWHLHEMINDRNRARAEKFCADLDDFVKKSPCLWIGLRTEIQRDEIAAAFFSSQGAAYNRSSPLKPEAFAIFPGYEKWPLLNTGREEGLLWFLKRPELFKEALENQEEYRETKLVLRYAKANMVDAENEMRNTLKTYVKQLLPRQYPGSGLKIAQESKQNFLLDFDIKTCPSLYAEYLLSDLTTGDTRTQPTASDMVDMQHIVTALPYVDIAVLDAKFTDYAKAIKGKWHTQCELSQVFSTIDEAMNAIETRCGQE